MIKVNQDSLTYIAEGPAIRLEIPGRKWQVAYAHGGSSVFLRSTQHRIKLGIIQTKRSEEEFSTKNINDLDWLKKNVASQQKNLTKQRSVDGIQVQVEEARAVDWVKEPNSYWIIDDGKSVNATLQFIQKDTMLIIYCTSYEGREKAEEVVVRIAKSKSKHYFIVPGL